jgi:YidC/Oxa1 family membrane protein insertase
LIELWNVVLLEPVVNFLVACSNAFGGSFGLAIVAVTIIVNIIILPLTIKQTRSMKQMQTLQPKMKEIQKKYAKDKQKLQQETMKLYKESGINPVGCALPLLIQMPIWIALYQSIMKALPTTPERLLGLSDSLYSWSFVQGGVPPNAHFLGLNLAEPNFIMVLLVMGTMWISQKMSTSPSTDPKQQQMQQMMQWMMPLMFGFIFLNFPSGLPLYIVVMNLFRMVVQRFITGNWGGIETVFKRRSLFAAPAGGGALPEDQTAKEIKSAAKKSNVDIEKGKGIGDGSSRSKRKNRRRGR